MTGTDAVNGDLASMLSTCTVRQLRAEQDEGPHHRGEQPLLPDEVSDHILSLATYARRPGRDMTNDTDEILPTGGDPAIVDVTPDGGGYAVVISLVVPPVGRAS